MEGRGGEEGGRGKHRKGGMQGGLLFFQGDGEEVQGRRERWR